MADCRKILNSVEFNIFRVNPSVKPHILFYSNGLAVFMIFRKKIVIAYTDVLN